MKKLNTTYLDNLVSKILKETLEERADNLVSKIKGDVCECGGTMYEGECDECGSKSGDMYEESELIGKQKNIDVAKPKGKITSADFKKLRNSKVGNKHEMEEGIYDVDKTLDDKFDYVGESDDIDYSTEDREKTCQYHIDNFGENDPVTKEMCQGFNLSESLKSRHRKQSNKSETDEGNAFTGALSQARKKGDKNFEVNGKKFETSEQKLIDRKGGDNSFKRYCNGDITKSCVEKALKSGSESLVKKAKNSRVFKGVDKKKIKESYQLSESEIVGLIEKIVLEQKNKEVKDPAEKNNIKGMGGSPRGLEVYKKAHNGSGKENDDNIKAVTKKMKDYLKDGSKGDYSMSPKMFPKGNGELEKMKKKAYVMSDDGKEFIDDFMSPGMENLDYDQIEPNEEQITNNIEGASKTGNNSEWANSVETGVNKKVNDKRKANKFAKARAMAYQKAKQPISDSTGEDTGKGVNIKLESEDKKTKQINEEFDRMKSLIGYSRKTQ